jgi:hypothetical protein
MSTSNVLYLGVLNHILILALGEHILFFTAALHFISDELLVLFQTLLYVEFEAHDIIKHALDFRVEFFAEGISANLELFVPVGYG